MNTLKSCFFKYFIKNLIHNIPVTNDTNIPVANIGKLAIIISILSFRLSIVAPSTTGADK